MRAGLGYRNLPVSQMADSYHSLITLLRSLDSAVDFRIANAIWYKRSLAVLPSFVSTARLDFDAPVRAADFTDPATKAAINRWVDSSTAGKIPSLIDRPLSPRSGHISSLTRFTSMGHGGNRSIPRRRVTLYSPRALARQLRFGSCTLGPRRRRG